MGFTLSFGINGESLRFTLTCTSTGGPATTVTWTRDTQKVSGGMTVLDDPVTTQYTHTLAVTGRLGGQYQCIVSNNKPSTASAQLTLTGSVCSKKLYIMYPKSPLPVPDPPSGLTVSQNGLHSVLVSWRAPSGRVAVTGYIIYYQQEGGGWSAVSAGPNATTATISGLIEGAVYSITIVATSSTLLSTATGPQTITIGTHYVNWST